MMFTSQYRYLAPVTAILSLLFYVTGTQVLSPVLSNTPGVNLAKQITEKLPDAKTTVTKDGKVQTPATIYVWKTKDYMFTPEAGQFINHLPTSLLQSVKTIPFYKHPQSAEGNKPIYAVVNESVYFSWPAEKRKMFTVIKAAPYWYTKHPLLNLPVYNNQDKQWQQHLLLLQQNNTEISL